MNASEPLPGLSEDALLALVAEQQQQLVAQQRQRAELTARVETLQAEVERLRHGTKRQAAPFSKGTRVATPKRPGRKRGAGPFHYRDAPLPKAITEPPVDVPATFEGYPTCGRPLEEERVDLVDTTELPPMPRHQVRGQHPAVAPDQYGATAHRLGPWLLATAHALRYGTGIPVCKVPAGLRLLSGVRLTQGALTPYALRRAAIAAVPMVHTDDTSWRVGGEPALLMAFEREAATVYQVRPRHRHQEVQEVIPADDVGAMVTDRGHSYDAQAFEAVHQQKCLAHIQWSISDVLDTKRGRARDFGEQLKAQLQEALALWRDYRDGTVTDFKAEADALQAEVTYQLRHCHLKDPDNQRLLNEFGWHHDRGSLLRFLADPWIEPTNNRAEQALRPGVIAHKVSQCSKNDRGAHAFAAFTSVVRTPAKQGVDSLVESLSHLFRSPSVQGIAS